MPDSGEKQPAVLVRAKHAFNGKNNDELCFRKNDIITITQRPDGGWWEGTLGQKTAWFPSNYVVVVDNPQDLVLRSKGAGARQVAGAKEADRTKYLTMIINDMITQQSAHVQELTQNYEILKPLATGDGALSPAEYALLIGNLPALIGAHAQLLTAITEQSKQSGDVQRVGAAWLSHAPDLKALMLVYCRNHPHAVGVVTAKRAQLTAYMQSRDSDYKALVTGLSLPFRHLAKYAGALHELERNMLEGNADRGDTQRAAAVYADINLECNEARKQKEIQLEFMSTAQVQDDAVDLRALGQLRYVHTVAMIIEPTTMQTADRYVVIFEKHILVLSVTDKNNVYVVQFSFTVSPSLCVSDQLVSLPHTHNKCHQLCIQQTPNAVVKLLFNSFQTLKACADVIRDLGVDIQTQSTSTTSSSPNTTASAADRHDVPMPQPVRQASALHVTQLPAPQQAPDALHKSSTLPAKLNHELQMIDPANVDFTQLAQLVESPTSDKPLFSGWCLRPYPAARGKVITEPNSVTMRRVNADNSCDDTQLLKTVEAYCTTGGRMNTSFAPTTGRNDGLVNQQPQILVPEEEKMFIEEWVNDELVLQEKSLVDAVYSIKEQLNNMQSEMRRMGKEFEREQRHRKRLEELVKRQKDFSGGVTPLDAGTPTTDVVL